MPGRVARALAPIVALLALTAADAQGALLKIHFAGSRPPDPVEEYVIPFPSDAPLDLAAADSIIALVSQGKRWPETRYDLFHVDLDGDDQPETIAQVSRITVLGFYSRCWWGVYSGGALDQILIWNRADERARIARMFRPEGLSGTADSLTFFNSIPEFYPAVDVVRYGDLTGDGRPEIVVWMAGRAMQDTRIQGVLDPLILSPGPEGLREVFRAHLLHVRGAILGEPGSQQKVCASSAFRLRTAREPGVAPVDLLLEPWTAPVPIDSLCTLIGMDERMVPRDPEVWMPLAPLPSGEAIPSGWFRSRWNGSAFGAWEAM